MDDLTRMMAEDAKRLASNPDKLDKVRDGIRQLRDYEAESQTLQERLSDLSGKINEFKNKTLVDLFDEAQISSLGIEGDGNMPPYEIEIKPYYKANIPAENEAKAFAWLEKNKHGDMIKGTYTVSFGRGEEKQRKKFEALLKKGGYEYSYKFGVPWNTLTAFVKEQIEVYNRTPPLKLLGATVGRVASLVKKKDGQTKKRGK